MSDIVNHRRKDKIEYVVGSDLNLTDDDLGYKKHIYVDGFIDESLMYEDNSTTTKEDMDDMLKFASAASSYVKTIKKKKSYHWTTKNTSFLNLYNDLYKLGVKNNKFHLILYDKDLEYVDVYSELLPKETQLKVIIECMINPFYFLREVLRIPADGQPIEVGGGVAYIIDRNNIAGWYLFLNGIDHYRSKPRQCGKTQDCVAQFLYAYLYGNLGSSALFFNKDQHQANENLYRLKCQRDMLPPWMQMRVVFFDDGKKDKGTDNTTKIKNPANGNNISTMGKATSKQTAMKLGRGATTALQYYDEFDWTPWQTEIMKSASFAFSTAKRNAKLFGSLYCRILSSTPGELDTDEGADAAKYIERMLVWEEAFFDRDINQIKKILSSPAYNGFVFVEHSWKQLKKSIEWYEDQCNNADYDEETILREVELKRIHGSSKSPFKRSDLLYIINHQKDPIHSEDYSKNLSYIHIYEKINPHKPYILSIDPAEGLSEHNTGMVLIDPFNQKTIAEFKSPYISQPDMAKLMIRFMDQYCPKSMIIIENNRGRELINQILESKYKNNLYYDVDKIDAKPVEKSSPKAALRQQSLIRKAWGITTSSNRNQYFAILENYMEERKDLLYSKYVVKDICLLIRKPNGRIESAKTNKKNNGEEDGHGDVLMAYLIGIYVLQFGKYDTLLEFGIRRGASDTFVNDYDEQGNLTEEGTIRQMEGALDKMPDSIRSIMEENLKKIKVSKGGESYIDTLARTKQNQIPIEETIGMQNNPDGIAAVTDSDFWKDYDQRTINSNLYMSEEEQFFDSIDMDY